MPDNEDTNLKIGAEDDLRSRPYSRNASEKLPRWMELRDKSSNFQQFLSFSTMLDFNELRQKLLENRNNRFLDTADTEIPFVAFKINRKLLTNEEGNNPDSIDTENFRFEYKGKVLPITDDEVEFYRSFKTDTEKVLYSTEDRCFYFLQPYEFKGLKLIRETE